MNDESPTLNADELPASEHLFNGGNRSNEEARLVRRAVKNRWLSGRWQTHVPKKQLIEDIHEAGDITLAQQITLSVFELTAARDLAAKAWGARIGVSMESQNQRDEHKAFSAGEDQTRPEPTTKTPDQYADDMDLTIPFVPEKEAK